MRFFLREIIILFLCTYLVGELISRYIPIVPDIPQKTNINGYYELKSNQQGQYIKGKFPNFLTAEYSINNLGFNSIYDYDFNEDKNEKIKISIIGDSFVEGFHVDADKSIGRQIELKNDNYRVYEFGQAGFNYFNYKEIYQKYSLNNFDHVFLIIDLEDLLSVNPERTLYTKNIEIKENFFREFYDLFKFFKYLNWNHAFIREISKNISKLNFLNYSEIEKNIEVTLSKDLNLFIHLNPNIKLILKSEKDTILRTHYPKINFIEIDERLSPINFGFDMHWNINGRKNVANTILNVLSK